MGLKNWLRNAILTDKERFLLNNLEKFIKIAEDTARNNDSLVEMNEESSKISNNIIKNNEELIAVNKRLQDINFDLLKGIKEMAPVIAEIIAKEVRNDVMDDLEKGIIQRDNIDEIIAKRVNEEYKKRLPIFLMKGDNYGSEDE